VIGYVFYYNMVVKWLLVDSRRVGRKPIVTSRCHP